MLPPLLFAPVRQLQGTDERFQPAAARMLKCSRHTVTDWWLMETVMVRNLAFAIGQAAILLLFTPGSVPAAQGEFGTEKEAKAMLDKAVGAMKENKEKALEMFNKGEGGFKDRDLYVFCADAATGTLTAHPHLKGENLQDIVGKKGFPLGKEIMRTATEGK